MTRYDLNWNKLALAIVPIRLRRPLLMGFIYVLLSGVRKMATTFDHYRSETDYRLTHNGQVCHIRALLNDRFDPTQRRITIEDVEPLGGTAIYRRVTERYLMIPARTSTSAMTLSRRDFIGSDSLDFAIVVPAAMRGSFDVQQMRALADTYKLASKRYTITYR